MSKKIGIVGWKTGENSFGATLPYLTFFNQYGHVRVLSIDQEVEDLDLLVLPGGLDIDPKRYGQAPELYTGNPNIILEHFDTVTLPKYMEKGIPIVGICRGFQTINVVMGGTLNQDIFHDTSVKSRGELVHKLRIEERFKQELHINKNEVNSLHHQSVDRLGENLYPIAWAEDNTVEVIGHFTYPMYAFQYHPEEIYDRLSNSLIQKLLR